MAIVKNGSEGHGYNYASLSDIESQGHTIPKMKVGVVNEKEYIFYLDEESKEWLQGSQIVVPESPKTRDGKNIMSAAQLYGSALTYARRYTTLMALQLSCNDDTNFEEQPIFDKPIKKVDDGEPATQRQLETIKKYSQPVIDNIVQHYNLSSIDQISKAQATETIGTMLQMAYGKEQSNN